MPGDPPLDAVHWILLRSSVPTLLVDQRRPEGTSLTLEVGHRLAGTVIVGAMSVALEDISGIYLRPQDTTASAALDDLLLTIAELAPAVVLNRPEAMAANTSKPYRYSQDSNRGLLGSGHVDHHVSRCRVRVHHAAWQRHLQIDQRGAQRRR